MAKHFGTNGIRKKIKELTPEFVSGMCSSFAETIGKRGRIILGRDTRTSGEMVRGACIAGFLSSGCEVIDLGVVPSPTVEMEVLNLKADGGCIITASHNPPEWNALKFVDGKGLDVSKDRGEEVEKHFENGKFERADWDKIRGVENYSRALQDHEDKIFQMTDVKAIQKKKFKVILDCGNGTTGLIAPGMFRKLGCAILTLNCQPDGFFPGRNSEPTEKNLGDLISAMKNIRADLGIAWDGDGDRVIFINEKAEFIMGDKTFALCAQQEKRKKVVTTVATSNVIKDVSGEVIRTRVGAPYIAEKLFEIKGDMAGEEVGGVVWPEISYGKDGLITAVKMLEFMARNNKKISQLISALPEYHNYKMKVECASEKKKEAMERLKEQIKNAQGEKNYIDGVRIDFNEHEWVIARPSGTENFIRIFAEAKTLEKAEKICKEYEIKVKEIVQKA